MIVKQGSLSLLGQSVCLIRGHCPGLTRCQLIMHSIRERPNNQHYKINFSDRIAYKRYEIAARGLNFGKLKISVGGIVPISLLIYERDPAFPFGFFKICFRYCQ